MRKKIFRQTALLSSLGILLVSVLLCGVWYRQLAARVRADLEVRTQMFVGDDFQSARDNLSLIGPEDMRVTVVAPDGAVLYDNMARPQEMEDHLGRKEIQEALVSGRGESHRFSDTLDTETYYCAVRLTDGSVLRMARTTGSIWRVFAGALPAVTAAILLFAAAGYFASGRLARRVVEPIGRVDLSGDPDVPYDELAPFARVITDQRRQIAAGSAELQERAGTIDAIMDNMTEGVVLLDRRGAILSVNKSAAAIFGARGPMGGRSDLELLRDLDFHRQIGRALEGQRGEMNFSRGGREYRALISPAAQTGVVVLLLDITERARAEKMRREFSANVSHELKTPLTSIYGSAEMLRAGVVQEDDRPLFYGKIMDEAARLLALIEDIILLSELDEGKTRQLKERVDLAAVARECAGALAQKAAEHGVTVEVAGTGAMTASRSLMYELFYNLMDNGIKYNRPGGRVWVEILQTKEKTDITVSDTGIGISDADRDRIFERFYRADKSRSRQSGGTGLGLAIVRHIVLVHGGSIRLASRQGEGARFEITF